MKVLASVSNLSSPFANFCRSDWFKFGIARWFSTYMQNWSPFKRPDAKLFSLVISPNAFSGFFQGGCVDTSCPHSGHSIELSE